MPFNNNTTVVDDNDYVSPPQKQMFASIKYEYNKPPSMIESKPFPWEQAVLNPQGPDPYGFN